MVVSIVFFSTLVIMFSLFVWYAWQSARVDWGMPGSWLLDGAIRLLACGYKKTHLRKPQLPIQGGSIILSHMQNWLDPLLLIAATDRPIRFLVPNRWFGKKLPARILRAFGAIGVDQNSDESMVRAILIAVKSGEVVVCFQQGVVGFGAVNTALRTTIVRLVSHQSTLLFPVKVSAASLDKKYWMPGGASVASSEPMTCRKLTVESWVERVNSFLKLPEPAL